MLVKTPHSTIEVDVNLLEAELRGAVSGEVRFDSGSRAVYSTDGSNYRQLPIGVVVPKTREDIIQTVAICNKYGAPVLSRGGGTSLAGQCCNTAVVMDMTKYYNGILNIDTENKLAKVEPGIVLDELRKAAEKHGITFGPDPATHNHCALGGMLGNNSCGTHSVMAKNAGLGSRTSDNTERLTVLTYDGLILDVGPTSDEELEKIIQEGGRRGEIYSKLKALRDKYADKIREKFPKIPRRVSGYNIDELLPEKGFNVARALVGTEGTCVVILDATLKLLHKPKFTNLLVLGYPDISDAGRHAPIVSQFMPDALEGLDDKLIDYLDRKGMDADEVAMLPEGRGWLMAEFSGDTQEEADEKAKKVIAKLKEQPDAPNINFCTNAEDARKLWEVRKSGLGATAFVPGMKDTWEGWEDSAVPPEKVGDYLKDFRALFNKYNYHGSHYGHFGDGCIHTRIDFDLITKDGIEKYRKFTREAAELVVSYGGSLSGEHGDGQSRGDLLGIMFGDELLQAFREFKEIWDPQWKMNPGKVVDPYTQSENLRLGTSYHPPVLETHFHFPEDHDNFAHATLRCVGVGECRKHEGGTMCPSYMVTREEEHSTRGRARLLFEMLKDEEIHKGWESEEVKNALDLCLACKGCKGDCPVHVDMATYKSEFLSHYYEHKMRPRSAYAFGWIHWWARIASLAPGVANFLTSNPVTGPVAKWIAGVAPERRIPQFAETTFRSWFFARPKKNKGKTKVILWADTFNNNFMPETLVAATEVLEAAGFQVTIPKQMLCCGRPLYDFGMLNIAKGLLRDIMESLRDDITNGTPIVGLEPSCVAVFRDELVGLFPKNEEAKRLKQQVFTLAEFLQQKAPHFEIPQLKQKALVHGHCHHKAIMKMKADLSLLDKTGLDYQLLDSGCCGMAGYFGYEKGAHYEVGKAAGERVLLPAVREASPETIIMADGFSCREQIEQGTNRKAMHSAQVLQMMLRQQESNGGALKFPERQYVDNMKLKSSTPVGTKIALVLAGVSVIALGTLVAANRGKK